MHALSGRVRIHPSPTLAEAFDPRSNSLAVLRLLFAGIVALTHAFVVGYEHQPSLGNTHVADLAVDGFFVLSGFLVTRSFLRLGSTPRYAWHRFLRLMPAFWVCLAVTAVVAAPLAAYLEGRSPLSVFTADTDPAWRYVVVNAGLPIFQYGIAELGAAPGPPPPVFDGSLWTLRYEAFCYGVVALLGVLAILRRRRGVAVVCAAVWVALAVEESGHIGQLVPTMDTGHLLRFILVFLLGALAHLYADRLPISATLAIGSGVSVVASALLFPDYRLAGAFGFAYLCLWAMVRLPARFEPRWDLSYGLYVYHWPVQFLLALAGVTVIGEWPFAALSIALALVLAAFSWVLVEEPALRLKQYRLPRPTVR